MGGLMIKAWMIKPQASGPTYVFQAATAFDVNAGNQSGYTERLTIPTAMLLANASSFYIKFGYFDASWIITKAYCGNVAAAGDAYDFLDAPAQILFSTAANCTVGAGGLVSDLVTYNLDKTKKFMIALYFAAASSPPRRSSVETYGMYYKSGDDAATQNASGYTTSGNSGKRYFVDSIYF
jgi:hypothetical protein